MNYTIAFEPYTSNDSFVAKCNSVTFINSNTTENVVINGFTLTPGAQLTLEGLPGETDTTKYTIVFPTNGSGNLMVLRKIYVGG